MIGAGEEWKGAIDEHLESSRIILLLVSHNFIASDYCYDVEMKRALEKHKEHSAIVIPIILSPVDLHGQIFGKLQSLPRDRKPISGWNPRDEGWRNVAVGIREAIERLGTAGD